MDLSQLPKPALDVLSYQEGTSQGTQLTERIPEGQRDDFLTGFRAAVQSSLDEKAMLYAAGGHSARQAMEQGLNAHKMLQGMEDHLAGRAAAYTENEVSAAFAAFQEFQQSAQSGAASSAGENLAAGQAFLANNEGLEGVNTTDSGLQYQVLVESEGPKPAAADEVTVHYTGRLLNGTVFDSSHARGEPASFPLNRVIAGWTEGLQLMSVGSTYRFWIPSGLAYGANGPSVIGPHQVLDFEVQLLKIG